MSVRFFFLLPMLGCERQHTVPHITLLNIQALCWRLTRCSYHIRYRVSSILPIKCWNRFMKNGPHNSLSSSYWLHITIWSYSVPSNVPFYLFNSFFFVMVFYKSIEIGLYPFKCIYDTLKGSHIFNLLSYQIVWLLAILENVNKKKNGGRDRVIAKKAHWNVKCEMYQYITIRMCSTCTHTTHMNMYLSRHCVDTISQKSMLIIAWCSTFRRIEILILLSLLHQSDEIIKLWNWYIVDSQHALCAHFFFFLLLPFLFGSKWIRSSLKPFFMPTIRSMFL